MNTSTRNIVRTAVFALIALLVLAAAIPAWGRETGSPTKILIFEPTLYTGQDMAFIRRGVVEMLTSRLARPGEVIVLTQGSDRPSTPENDAAAVALGRDMGADYVLVQSVVVLGDSVSTNAKVLAADTGEAVLNFSRAGKEQADIIAHTDELAAVINQRLLGIRPSASPPVAADQGGGQRQETPDMRQHPDKLIPAIGADSGLWGESYSERRHASARLFLRGGRMGFQVRGVTAGDVLGNGETQVVAIDHTTIVLYRVQQKRLVKTAQADFGAANLGVDAADLNGNGRDELFVTHFDTHTERVLSYVLEWDGKALVRIADNLRFYFRSVDMGARGRLLVGQRQGFEDLFSPGIHEVVYDGATYDLGPKLALPRTRIVFGFARGDVQATGASNLVGYSKDHYLQVQDARSRAEWSSVDGYGGTANSIVTSAKDQSSDTDIFFLPSRVHLLDVDGDGLQEIVTVRNEDRAGVFSRTQLFRQGRLEILKWDQLGMVPIWRTRGIAKFIGDFVLADVSGDGTPELIAGIVQETRSALSAGSSFLAIFSLNNLDDTAQ